MFLPSARLFPQRLLRAMIAMLALTVALLAVPSHVTAQNVHIRLNSPLSPNQRVSTFAISPDSAHVVYVLTTEGDADRLALSELFSVPMSGGTPVLLSPWPPNEMPGGPVRFEISPDSAHVVYALTAEGDSDDPALSKLYSVPISGGVPVWLNRSADSEVVINRYQISPDGAYVVYEYGFRDDTSGLRMRQLYSVPINGGVPAQLSPPSTVRHFDWFQISPDSRHVVFYSTAHDSHEPIELYTVPISGGTPVQLKSPVEFLHIGQYAISRDSRHIVVFCRWELLFEIYSFPIEGGEPVRLSNALEFYYGELYNPAPFFLLVLDDTQVLYPTWDDARKRHVLVTVPVGGGAPAELAAGAGPVQMLKLCATMPDGTYAFYAVGETSGVFLYSVPILNGPPVRLTEVPGIDCGDDDWQLFPSPDGSRVVIIKSGEPFMLSVSVRGGAPAVLSKKGDIHCSWLHISPDGSHVLYSNRSCGSDYDPLYIVPIEGGTPIVIAGAVNAGFSPDGAHVVYQTRESDLYVTTAATDWLHTFLPRVQSPEPDEGTARFPP